MSHPYSIIIIGGGIIGAAFSYAASQRAMGRILLIDNGTPSPADDSATARSWAWVNAATNNDKSYFQLRHASMQIWEEWIAAEAGLEKTASGGFLWDLPGPQLEDYIETHAKWGYPVNAMGRAAIAEHLPWLKDVPEIAAYCEAEFAIEPMRSAQALIKASGAEVITGQVDDIICDGQRVSGVKCGTMSYHADEVIMAAGSGAQALLERCGITLALAPTNGLLITTQSLPPISSYLVTAPDYHFRQMPDGALLIGGRFNEDLGVADDVDTKAANAILRRVEAACALPEPLQIRAHSVGKRVIPKGGLPVIGRFTNRNGTKVQGLYGAIMHSGISNAAGVAHYAIDDILTQDRPSLLQPYQPEGWSQ